MKYAIYSCEGNAREILPSLRHQLADKDADIVFVDDGPAKSGTVVHQCNVLSFEQLCETPHRDRLVSVAVADSKIRETLVQRCESHGFKFFEIRDRSHIRFENVEVREGAIFCANTTITTDVRIGRHFQCNIYSYVTHDCRIGDFVTFAPRVSCNGRVEIDDFAYIGAGAILKQGTHDRHLRIGKGAIVGMGAVVLKDVEDGEVVVGNPAKVIRTIA